MKPLQIHSSKFPWESEEAKQMRLKGIDDVMITVKGFVGTLCNCSFTIPEDKRELFSYAKRAVFYCAISPKVFANIHSSNEKWIVVVKGKWDDDFEISVAKQSAHGVHSWGWFGANKILISHSGGPCESPIPKCVWDKLIKVANEVADELNNNELSENVTLSDDGTVTGTCNGEEFSGELASSIEEVSPTLPELIDICERGNQLREELKDETVTSNE